jgi:hypothetical protein
MERLAECCGAVITGTLTAGNDGMVDLRDLQHLRGPPGLWQLQLKPLSQPGFSLSAIPPTATLELRVTGRVARLQVLSAWTLRRPVLAREILPQQPEALLTDPYGAPVAGATCVAFSSDRPDVQTEGGPGTTALPSRTGASAT